MDAPTESPKLRESLRSLPGSAFVLFAGTLVNNLGMFVVPFFALYLTRRGYSVPQAGLALASYGLGELVSQVTGGLLADRLGRRNAIALSMFASGGLVLALWQAEGLVPICALMFAFAWAAELNYPAAAALITDVVPSRGRVAAFTLFRLALNVGNAGGLALGGFLADRWFDALFIGEAATSIAFGFLSLAALPHGVRSARRDEVDLPTARRSILADHGFLLFLGAMLLMRLVYAQSISTLPLHVTDHGFRPSTFGLLMSLNCALVVVAELPIIAWVQRRPLLRAVAAGQLLNGLGFAALLFAGTIPLLVGSVLVWSLGEMLTLSAAQGIASERAPEHARGRYQSALGVTRGAGFTLGPMLGTLIYAAGPDVLWWACGGLGLVSAWLSLTAQRLPAPEAVTARR